MKHAMYARFDEIIERKGTLSVKWDQLGSVFHNENALAMWVADMDFKAPDEVTQAILRRAAHGIFGYTLQPAEEKQAVATWLKTRHGLDARPDWVFFSPGVVDSIYHTLRAVASPGDFIVIQPPVYGPFRFMTEKAGLNWVENPLLHTEDGWKMDLNQLEDVLKTGPKAMILCSPHNPIGRIWSRDELTALAALLNRYHVTLICDEIHADFELPGARHTPILDVEGAQSAVMLISATKTFNLAGLRHSSVVIADEALRKKVYASFESAMATDTNLFGALSQRAAYENGGAWLDALNEYLGDSRDMLVPAINRLPGLRADRPDSTYLLWIDCRDLNMTDDELGAFFTQKCGVVVNNGTFFGRGGSGFVRLNFAAPHARIEEAFDRIYQGVRSL